MTLHSIVQYTVKKWLTVVRDLIEIFLFHYWRTPSEEMNKNLHTKRKIPLVRKSYSLCLQIMLQKGVDDVGEDDDD
jgi:hypothetical protein